MWWQPSLAADLRAAGSRWRKKQGQGVSIEGDELLLIFSVEKERRVRRILTWSSTSVEKERSTSAMEFNGGCASC
jgi:hypothetical protein